MLASLLLPALSSAKATAVSANCKSNLRQLSLMYGSMSTNTFGATTNSYGGYTLGGTNRVSRSTNDYNLAIIQHWLRRKNDVAYVTDTLSMMRNASPTGSGEGQKVWYDYKAKSGSQAWCQGTNSGPCFEAVVLPDGNTRFKYKEENKWGFPTTITTTYSSNSVVAQRSLTFTYAASEIDQLTMRGPSSELLSSNAYNSVHQVLTNFNAVNDLTRYTYDSAVRLTSIKTPTGLTTTNLYYASGTHIGWLQQTIDLEISRTNGFGYSNGQISAQTNGLVVTYTRDSMDRALEWHSSTVACDSSEPNSQ